MPFVTRQPAYNVLYELIARTIKAVKELDSLQAERFQRKIRFALQEPNGAAGDGAIASALPEEVSTGDESAVCPADVCWPPCSANYKSTKTKCSSLNIAANSKQLINFISTYFDYP